SESAKEAWNYAVANSPPGLLSALDGAVLERWANCSGLYREALSKINRAGVSGMIIKTPSGILRRSPLMDVIRDLALEMKGYGNGTAIRLERSTAVSALLQYNFGTTMVLPLTLGSGVSNGIGQVISILARFGIVAPPPESRAGSRSAVAGSRARRRRPE
ncbi:MAG: P27 family phage terminase small subunit, partial [Candidatus Accumulibacter sp.]